MKLTRKKSKRHCARDPKLVCKGVISKPIYYFPLIDMVLNGYGYRATKPESFKTEQEAKDCGLASMALQFVKSAPLNPPEGGYTSIEASFKGALLAYREAGLAKNEDSIQLFVMKVQDAEMEISAVNFEEMCKS